MAIQHIFNKSYKWDTFTVHQKHSNINIVQNFGHVQNKSIIYRLGIYNLQTRTSTFPDQGKLLERVNLRYLKTLKTKN